MSKLRDLVEHIAKVLVDNPDAVQINEIEGEQTSVIELKVAKEGLGKIIGILSSENIILLLCLFKFFQ